MSNTRFWLPIWIFVDSVCCCLIVPITTMLPFIHACVFLEVWYIVLISQVQIWQINYYFLFCLYLAGSVPFLFLLAVVGCAGRPFYPLPSKGVNGGKQPLQTSRPFNIAHRGSNGELPEETAPAYRVIYLSMVTPT